MSSLIENAIAVNVCSQTVTDWEILNCMTPKRLKRILKKQIECNSVNIKDACDLISAYHQVYRQDLLQLRHQGRVGSCPSPTFEQLQRIANLQQNNKAATPQQILIELQKLASLLNPTNTSIGSSAT